MRRVLGALLLLGLAVPATAQVTEEEALERFFTRDIQAEWFAPSFLAQVPADRLAPILEQVTGSLGAFVEVRPDGDRWMAVYEKGRVPTLLTLDAEGRFTGLRMLAPILDAESFDDVQATFDDLPGDGHLLVRVDGEPVHAYRADEPFAVGSAFKLVVLKALVDQIGTGDRDWADVVEFSDGDRGLQTGTLGNWPTGAPVTLHTLATLMIAQSDNEATDALIRVLGREAVEAADPSGRNRPFLTTAEAFKLKDPDNPTLLARWREADETARRDVLLELTLLEVPSAAIFSTGKPVATDVEWLYTAEELCDLIEGLADLELMGVNPGVVEGDDFDRVAYKGGSEPGVLNMTTWTEDDGRTVCVCATKNADEEISTSDFASLVASVFALVEE